jgi:hypothetical protein
MSKLCVHVAPGKQGAENSQLYFAWHAEEPGSHVYVGLHPALAATARAASASARRAAPGRIANGTCPAWVRVTSEMRAHFTRNMRTNILSSTRS